MSAEYSFPTLRLALLHSLRDLSTLLATDPQMLRGPTCPYDNETIELLESFLVPKVIEKVVTREAPQPKRGRGAPKKEPTLGEDELDELGSSAKDLLKDLKKLGEGEVELDTSARVQIVRAKAALIETVMKQVERVYNIKRISGFEAVVVGILEDLIPDAERDEFLRRLEPYRSK